MDDPLLNAINQVRAFKGLSALNSLEAEQSLRQDLELDSLDQAELSVRLEAATGIDVYAGGPVRTVGEIRQKLCEG